VSGRVLFNIFICRHNSSKRGYFGSFGTALGTLFSQDSRRYASFPPLISLTTQAVMLTKIILWRFTASMPTKLKWKSTAPGATKFSDCARHSRAVKSTPRRWLLPVLPATSRSMMRSAPLKTSSSPRAQGVSARQAPPFASPARNWKVRGACPLRLRIRIAESQLLQSRPYF
jgi:hypothetical protein